MRDADTNLSYNEFQAQITMIFGITMHKAYMICDEWFQKNKRELTKKILKHLEPYRVEMTQFDWVTIDEVMDEKISLESLVAMFSPYYDGEKVIRTVCEEWLEEKQSIYLKKKL